MVLPLPSSQAWPSPGPSGAPGRTWPSAMTSRAMTILIWVPVWGGWGAGPATGPQDVRSRGSAQAWAPGGRGWRDVTRPAPEPPAHSSHPGGARAEAWRGRARRSTPLPRAAPSRRAAPRAPASPPGGRLRLREAEAAAAAAVAAIDVRGRAHDPAGTNRAGAERLLQSLN